jgi:hypothetical protein
MSPVFGPEVTVYWVVQIPPADWFTGGGGGGSLLPPPPHAETPAVTRKLTAVSRKLFMETPLKSGPQYVVPSGVVTVTSVCSAWVPTETGFITPQEWT